MVINLPPKPAGSIPLSRNWLDTKLDTAPETPAVNICLKSPPFIATNEACEDALVTIFCTCIDKSATSPAVRLYPPISPPSGIKSVIAVPAYEPIISPTPADKYALAPAIAICFISPPFAAETAADANGAGTPT